MKCIFFANVSLRASFDVNGCVRGKSKVVKFRYAGPTGLSSIHGSRTPASGMDNVRPEKEIYTRIGMFT